MSDLYAELGARARELIVELPTNFVIPEHPRGIFRWKGTYPDGWVKHNDHKFVEDYLFMVAAVSRT